MTATPHHADGTASPWVQRWTPLVAPGASVLDVACGHGRHMRWFAERDHAVTGVDRDTQALDAARAWGETVWADIEVDPWPFEERRFGAVVVTHYLWRLLLPTILDSVQAGGVLIYETFAQGNETVGRPSRPDFLLRPGELLGLCSGPGWRVVAYEDGFLPEPERFVQRIAAVRLGDGATDSPQRFPLSDARR